MAEHDVLRRAVMDVLGIGAMTYEEIADEIISRGLLGDTAGADNASDRDTVVDEIRDALVDDLGFAEVTGGIVYLPAVLDGTTWSVPVDAADAAEGRRSLLASPATTPA